jgi:hypothetical protein
VSGGIGKPIGILRVSWEGYMTTQSDWRELQHITTERHGQEAINNILGPVAEEAPSLTVEELDELIPLAERCLAHNRRMAELCNALLARSDLDHRAFVAAALRVFEAAVVRVKALLARLAVVRKLNE